MKQTIEKIETATIRRYGFENWRTILTFRLTSILRAVV